MKQNYVVRGIGYLKRNGITNSVFKAAERIKRDRQEASYNQIARSLEPDDKDAA